MIGEVVPPHLAREWRSGESQFIQKRRGIIALTLCSCAALGVTALYQIGVLKKLPQPALPGFSSKRVHRSAQAYSMLDTPDALLGLASYSVTAALAASGSQERWHKHPAISTTMGLKLLADAAFASKLTADEFTKIRAFSIWSLLVTACTFGSLFLGAPEFATALKRLRRHGFTHASPYPG